MAVAYVISTYGETQYLPLMERLERELLMFKEGRDPVSRARAILQVHAGDQGRRGGDHSAPIASHDPQGRALMRLDPSRIE